MEWLLLYMVLSAIVLEGVALFVNEESYHYAFVKESTRQAKIDIMFSTIMAISVYLLFLILSPVMVYIMLSMED